MIGSGVLSQAWVVSQSGLVVAAVIYPIIAAITFFGVVVMIEAANRTGVYHFGNLAGRVLGGFGLFLTEWSIIVSILMCLVAYLLLIGDMLVGIAKNYHSTPLPFYASKNFLVVVIVVMIVLPICLVRRLGHLTYVAYVSQTIVAAVVVAVVATADSEIAQHRSEQLVLGSFGGFLDSVGIVVFAIAFNPALFHVHRAMSMRSAASDAPPDGGGDVDGPTHDVALAYSASSTDRRSGGDAGIVTSKALGCSNLELAKVSLIATIAGTLVLALVGLLGYASFRDAAKVNIVDCFPGSLGVSFRIIATLHLLLFIPAEFVIMRASFSNYFTVDVESQEDVSYILYTVVSVAVVTTVTLLLNDYAPSSALAALLNLCGGVACSVYAFVVPGMLGKAVFAAKSDFKPNAYSITLLQGSRYGGSSSDCGSGSSSGEGEGGDEDDDAGVGAAGAELLFFWGSVCMEVFGYLSIMAVVVGQFV